jgi:hypothetical protein
MTVDAHDKVERTRQYLLNSALPEDTKDGLQMLLDAAAAATNGHKDKLQALTEVMLLLAIHETKQAVRQPGRLVDVVRAEINQHVGKCPWRNAAESMPRWALWIYTFRWQATIAICVAFFSPQAPAIIRTIMAAAK